MSRPIPRLLSLTEPPNQAFAFDEAPTLIQQYTRHLKEANIDLRKTYGANRTEHQVGTSLWIRETIDALQCLEEIMTRTITVMRASNFGERGSRCFVEGHVFTAHLLLIGVLNCAKYILVEYEKPALDHEGARLWPEGCFWQLHKLADAHGRRTYQVYAGDDDVEEYKGDGPKAVLRDISGEAGQLIRELVETAEAFIGVCEWLWVFPTRSKYPAPSDAGETS